MDLQSLFLAEINWRDISTVPQFLTKHAGKNRFVHFSKVHKLGVNPKPKHRDPIGIYFYPVDWILTTDSDRLISGQQYAVDWPYWFVVEADLSGPGLVLSRTTWDTVERLATKNGWKDHLNAFHANPDQPLPHWIKRDKPGSVLWYVLDELNREGTLKWNTALKGLDFIYDDNNSIIHNMEPHQLLVFNKRIVRIVDSGINRTFLNNKKDRSYLDPNNEKDAQTAIVKFLKQIADTYKGKFTWMRQQPSVTFNVGDREFDIGIDLLLNYKFGRASGYRNLRTKDPNSYSTIPLAHLSLDTLHKNVQSFVDEIMALPSDLPFTTPISEDELKSTLTTRIADSSEVNWKATEIEIEYNSLTCTGSTFTTPAGTDLRLERRLYGRMRKQKVETSVYMFVNGEIIAHGGSELEYENPRTIDLITAKAAMDFSEKFRYHARYLSPDTKTKFDYNPRLRSTEDWLAFQGWYIINCGLTFDGRLEQLFADEIRAYREHTDQKNLLKDIEYVLKWRARR